jgi:hypothetical protein
VNCQLRQDLLARTRQLADAKRTLLNRPWAEANEIT